MGGVRVQRVLLPGGAATWTVIGGTTWTVIGGDGLSIEAAEEYLEYLRVSSSPNTVKSYARRWRCGGGGWRRPKSAGAMSG
ncbi:MAG: hypothetical protein ACLP0L_17770 [Solirubrobacteraceae bacterium]